MRDVRREFADESELVSLSIGDGVAGFKEGACQRFLVREDLETSSLQHMAEFEDRRVNREELEIIRRVSGLSRRGMSTEEAEGLEVACDDLMDGARDGLGVRVGVDAEFGARRRMEK